MLKDHFINFNHYFKFLIFFPGQDSGDSGVKTWYLSPLAHSSLLLLRKKQKTHLKRFENLRLESTQRSAAVSHRLPCLRRCRLRPSPAVRRHRLPSAVGCRRLPWVTAACLVSFFNFFSWFFRFDHFTALDFTF